MSGCYSCGVCNACQKKSTQCSNATCLKWGFDDCYLRARCPDGKELDPLNLCEWLDKHETCTTFRLVPGIDDSSYIEYVNECDVVEKIYVCDMLGLANLECLGNVYHEKANPCDILVYSPDCNDPNDARHDKWTHHTIQNKGDLEPDDNGYFKVLSRNDCGCIEERNLFMQSHTWEYSLRDSWPDDPDWPFTVGSYTETIDTLIDQKCPMFGKTDLEVTVQYGFGIQHQGPVTNNMTLDQYHHFVSTVTPSTSPNPSSVDVIQKAITVAGVNVCPWGSHESQVSRTFIVPKGKKLYLRNEVIERDWLGNIIPQGATGSAPGEDCSRLHALHIFVRTTIGNKTNE